MRAGGLEGLDDITRGHIELLGHGGSHHRPIGSLRGLTGEVHGAAGLGNDRVRETEGRREGIRVADLVRAGYRPVPYKSHHSRISGCETATYSILLSVRR